MIHVVGGFQHVYLPHHLVHGAKAEFGHDLAQVLCQEREQVDDVLRLAGKQRPQLGVLGGHAHRTGVQVALAHHDATLGDQGGGRHSEFFGSQQNGDRNVAPGFDLPVGLHGDAAAQIVLYQRLVGFG